MTATRRTTITLEPARAVPGIAGVTYDRVCDDHGLWDCRACPPVTVIDLHRGN